MRILAIFIILLGVLVNTGCQPTLIHTGTLSTPTSISSVSPPAIPTIQVTEIPERIKPTSVKLPASIAPTQAITPVTGEVPEQLLNSILKDLSERINTSIEQITVIQAQEIVWNDGSLGCPQPGVMYIQSLIPGFRVLLEAGDRTYDYHAADTGYYFLCESTLPILSPLGTPDS